LAASKADIKKFPPVAGEIYGNAAPGVKSITVNGKPVKIGAEQSFVSLVNLKAGEKYLVLRINYEGLTIIKKYLILRREAIKKFKVFVAKENIEKMAQEAKAREGKPRRPKVTKELAEKKGLSPMTAEQQSWTEKVVSPRFFPNEFKQPASLEALATAVSNDKFPIAYKSPANSLARLNELIITPNFYDLVADRGKILFVSTKIKALIKETKSYRGKDFSSLNSFEQKKIMLLNRLLIETLYSQAPARANWLIALKPSVKKPPKVYEYLYVWEFSEGKLLIVKQTKGKYSAIVHIPVSKEWLDVKGLSAKDLEELIGKMPKPVKSKKSKL